MEDTLQYGTQLPRYKCHKEVQAAKITAFRQNGNPDMPDLVLGEIGGLVTLLPDWHVKHKPEIGGYYVVYGDGYASYSPAKAFEDGYTLAPADFKARVRAEKAELDGRLTKLLAFIAGATFANIPREEQVRMRTQSEWMLSYSNTLGERISAFGG